MIAAAFVVDQGAAVRLSHATFATPGPAWSERDDDGLRLSLAEDFERPAVSTEAEVATRDAPDAASSEPEATEPSASGLIWHLNWLRRAAGLFGFQADARLGAIAEGYCPDLALYFDKTYDPASGNWAEAMVHNAGGSNLITRSAEAKYPGWANELLAWTADRVDLSLVARGFWDAPTHKATITSPEPTLAGAAVCEGIEGYFYVVVIGGGAAPLAQPEHARVSEPAPGHNPFIIP